MKKIFLLLLIPLSALFAGCFAVHQGYLQGSAALNQPNFRYLSKNAEGRSFATYVFGIGGLVRESLVAEAKEQLMRKNPLQDNQAYANFTVSYKKSNILLVYMQIDCIITADIVEYSK